VARFKKTEVLILKSCTPNETKIVEYLSRFHPVVYSNFDFECGRHKHWFSSCGDQTILTRKARYLREQKSMGTSQAINVQKNLLVARRIDILLATRIFFRSPQTGHKRHLDRKWFVAV
jgi:hypothetical protein